MSTFIEWVNGAAKQIKDPAARQQFTSSMNSILATAPELNQIGEQSLLLQRDYSRVIEQSRAQQAQAQAEIEAERQRIEAERIAFETERNNAQRVIESARSTEAQLAAYGQLYNRLTELDVFNMVLPEETIATLPAPTPITIEEDMPNQFTDDEVSALKSWIATLPKAGETAPVAPAPAQPAQPDPQYVTTEQAAQHYQNLFAATSIGNARMLEAVQRFNQLAGKSESFAEHVMQWQTQALPLETYIENTFKLSALESEAQARALESRIEARAQEIIDQRVAAGSLNPAVAAPIAQTTPFFGLIGQAPTNAKITPTNPQTPVEPAAGATPPPAPKNSNEAFAGLDAAAQSLATNKYSGERFNPLRPMGA